MSESIDYYNLDLSDWESSSDSTLISCQDHNLLHLSNQDLSPFGKTEALCNGITSLECDKFSTAHSATKIPCFQTVFKRDNTESRHYKLSGSENFQNTSISRQTINKTLLAHENKSQYSINEKVFGVQGNIRHKSSSAYQEMIIQENPSDEIISISRQESSDSRIRNDANQKYSESQLNISNHVIFNKSKIDPKLIASSHQSTGSQKMNIFTQESADCHRMITLSQDTFDNQKIITSSQEISYDQRMITSSQEISDSQKMITSSQEISDSQKMITSSQEISDSQKMITSSQEISDSQKMITSSQEISDSQKMIILSHVKNRNNKMFKAIEAFPWAGYSCRRDKEIVKKRIRKRKLSVWKKKCTVKKLENLVAAREAGILKHEKVLKDRKTKIFECDPSTSLATRIT